VLVWSKRLRPRHIGGRLNRTVGLANICLPHQILWPTPQRHAARQLRPERAPCQSVRRRAGRVADRLADDGAAVPMLPGWSGVMATDRLVVEKEGRDRLAKTMIDDLLWWTETLKTARTIAS
jgi:hypothetical protein